MDLSSCNRNLHHLLWRRNFSIPAKTDRRTLLLLLVQKFDMPVCDDGDEHGAISVVGCGP